MLNEEIDDHDYHHDFTTASEWECFIAKLEELIHDWKLTNVQKGPPLKENELSSGEWLRKSENILFNDIEFSVTRYYLNNVSTNESENLSPIEEDQVAFDPTSEPSSSTTPLQDIKKSDDNEEDNRSQALEDIMSYENTFPSQYSNILSCSGFTNISLCEEDTLGIHPLVRWYNLRDFVVLSPTNPEGISSESKAKILLSSIYIAVNNSNCMIPFFVQIHKLTQHYYIGVCESRGLRTEFEMVHLKRTPAYLRYLTGLLSIFKAKVTPLSTRINLDKVIICARFTYILHDWRNLKWFQKPLDFEIIEKDVALTQCMTTLPFGTKEDPIKELRMTAYWPKIHETAIVDSETYSDLDANRAPRWILRAISQHVPGLLSDVLNQFDILCSMKIPSMDLLPRGLIKQDEYILTNSLCSLTESKASRILRRHGETKRSEIKGPVSNKIIIEFLYFLFPDSDSRAKEHCYPRYSVEVENESSDIKIDTSQKEIKAAPLNSLVSRIAAFLVQVAQNYPGAKELAHLWYEIILEFRYRWDYGILIPGVEPGHPNMKTCLFHQTLQLINCCIERRNSRNKAVQSTINKDAQAGCSKDFDLPTGVCGSESDEEFFDASSEEPLQGVPKKQPEVSTTKHSLWNMPVGRMRRLGNLRLLETGESLYIPHTQDPAPKTELSAQLDEEQMVQMGAEGRVRLMSASLLSDMESFKAANPGAILADFIRWYSPRDWIEAEDDPNTGELSPRMKLDDNPWIEAWTAAKPVPAHRQKRIFDETFEAERALNFLQTQTVSGIAHLIAPCLAQAVFYKTKAEVSNSLIPNVEARIETLYKDVSRATRGSHVGGHLPRYLEVFSEIASLESLAAQSASLLSKLPKDDGGEPIVRALMTGAEVELPGGSRGPLPERVRNMFQQQRQLEKMLSEAEGIDSQSSSTSSLPAQSDMPVWSTGSSPIFPQPVQKEFILRVSAARPDIHCSQKAPQRMTVVLKRYEMRMAGCFTKDTTFYKSLRREK